MKKIVTLWQSNFSFTFVARFSPFASVLSDNVCNKKNNY